MTILNISIKLVYQLATASYNIAIPRNRSHVRSAASTTAELILPLNRGPRTNTNENVIRILHVYAKR